MFIPGAKPNSKLRPMNIAKNRILKKIVSNSVKKRMPEIAKKTRSKLTSFITALTHPSKELKNVKSNYTKFIASVNLLPVNDLKQYERFIRNSTTTSLQNHIRDVRQNIFKK